MIYIFRSTYDSVLNVFHGREWVKPDEVRLVSRLLLDGPYTYAEPTAKGWYAFGGTFLYTSNGVHPEFDRPIPLHDRDMSKETRDGMPS